MNFIMSNLEDMVGTIIFNNDAKRNSLNFEMLDEILNALEEFKKNKARVVIIRSSKGAKVWSAGLSIDELPEPGKDPLTYNHPLEKVLRTVQRFPAPVIAMTEGSVWGGACDLAFVCDILIGSHNTSFAITPAKIGVPYNSSGILHFLNILGLNVAKEMFFTAKPITAQRANNLGILNYLLPAEEIEEFTYKLAKGITHNSPLSISVIKEQLNILGSSDPINPSTFERVQELRNHAYESSDYLEGKRAFLEKRKPIFTGK